eukprot:TRINITY_DN9544_c0_g1_i1.p1 TRINITY_DN9544_c0_g1~~TRINITY_DN9544_c0_g1_i1.p1  ORF type:complete len:519 (+),score=101.73 TRINITY_DN9544_c0_g1_i1:3-1559(+)
MILSQDGTRILSQSEGPQITRHHSSPRMGEDLGPEIKDEEIIFDQHKDLIGEGTFGKVYKGKHRGKDVSVKVLRNQNLTEDQLKEFRKEVGSLRHLMHPNLTPLVGACTKPQHLMIVAEYIETDLENFLWHLKGKIPLIEKIRMARDAAEGILFLHSKNILHQNLKPTNLLVAIERRKRTIKVTDYGFRKFAHHKNDHYMAPELMLGKSHSEKSDVYAFGLIFYEILAESELFPAFQEWEDFYEAICIHRYRPPLTPECTAFTSLLNACWHATPDQRPEFKQIIFHLSEAIVDCHLSLDANDPQQQHLMSQARLFWKENFLIPYGHHLLEDVPWSDFVQVLASKTQRPTSDFDHLRKILACKSRNGDEQWVVTIQRFGRITGWFGPFFSASKSGEVLKNLNALMMATWFHNDISKEVAENRLYNRPVGTYLIRLSTTHKERPFTISKIGSDRQYQHKRVTSLPNGDGFSVPVRNGGFKTFKSIQELVESPELGLTIPCPQHVKPGAYTDDEDLYSNYA